MLDILFDYLLIVLAIVNICALLVWFRAANPLFKFVIAACIFGNAYCLYSVGEYLALSG